ncbi:hypothetical protein cypCar_00023632, partial [Cyprinus carpio]
QKHPIYCLFHLFLLRSGSVKHHWHEIYNFVEHLAEKFTRFPKQVMGDFTNAFYTFLQLVTISGLFLIVSQPNAANVLHRVLIQRNHDHETHGKQVLF